MLRGFRFLFAVCGVAGLVGCHTLTGVVSGPTLGGASLTSRLWNSKADDSSKCLATPFAFVAGTVAGPFVTIPRGLNRDVEQDWFDADGYLRVMDPFDAGFFEPESPKAE